MELIRCRAALIVLAGALVGASIDASQAPVAPQAAATKSGNQERLARIRAELFAGTNRPDDAVRELKEILAVDPGSAEVHMLLGIAYRTVGAPDLMGEAIAEFRQALALDPSSVPARYFLAHIYFELGRNERAREELDAALALAPRSPQFLALLGEVERQLKNPTRSLSLGIAPSSISGQANGAKADRPALFVDVTARAKIDFVHKSGASPEKYMVETFGSGVAWIDYDNDGFQDLYFVNGAPGAANVLYRANRDGTFSDTTAQARVDGGGAGKNAYKTGVAVGDYDGNGYLDLYVTSFGPNLLYKNNGDGTFADVTTAAGVAGGPSEWSTSTSFLDFDRDGDLDLYVTNYLDFRRDDNPYCGLRKDGYRMYCHPTMFDGVADRLFRNNGNGTFTDVSKDAAIANPAGKGLGVTVCDFDRDGDPDIYVANDMVRNFLYRNNGNGTFVDVAYAAGVGFDGNGKPQAGMGVDCGDVDANGFPDIFVTNFSEELNTLYSNLGEGLFEDVTTKAGLGSGFIPLGFGTKMFDLDNDGDLDLHVTNGHVIDNVKLYQPNLSYAQKDLLYENVGGRFRDVSAQSSPALEAERVGRGLAVADFDNDGNLDVVISSVGRPAVLLKNQGPARGNWIVIRAQGTKSNGFGLGATVRVQSSNGVQVREINNVASYLSANDIRLHVGLGAAKSIQQIDVLWPSGTKQTLKDVAVNQMLVIKEP